VKKVGIILFLCFAASSLTAAQTPPVPDTPQPQTEQQKENRNTRRGVTTFWPAAASASTSGKLTPGQKFRLFGFNTVNPFPIAAAAAAAGISQAVDSQEGYGQGPEGYGKRFGAAYANTASSEFFGTFLFPVLFKQDPRYFRKVDGSGASRISYAVSRVFVTRNDSGSHGPNVSLLLGLGAAAALSNTYYPAGDRSAGDAALRFGITCAGAAGFNVFKEFWPDLKSKLFHKK
jgi:hypothetical protein